MSHRWQSKVSSTKHRCEYCKESISRLLPHKKCTDCGMVAHDRCTEKFLTICGSSQSPARPPSIVEPLSVKRTRSSTGPIQMTSTFCKFCSTRVDSVHPCAKCHKLGCDRCIVNHLCPECCPFKRHPTELEIFDEPEIPEPLARQNKPAIFQWGGESTWKIEKLLFGEQMQKISAGGSHCIGLSTNGRVFVWGKQRRNTGVLGAGLEAQTFKDPKPVEHLSAFIVTDVSAGPVTTSAVTSDGRLFLWGSCFNRGAPTYEPKVHPSFGSMNVQAIEFTSSSALVLVQSGDTKEDTEVWSWGENANLLGHALSELASADTTHPRLIRELVDESVVQISMSDSHCAAVTAKGNIFVWGQNDCSSNLVRKEAQVEFPILGTKSSRAYIEVPQKVVFRTTQSIRIIEATCGKRFTVALTDDGRLFSWGEDNYGGLGLGDSGNRYSPTLINVPEIENKRPIIKGVKSGGRHCVAWTDEGEIFSWGWGHKFCLGNPLSVDDVSTPKRVGVLEKQGFNKALVFQIACTNDRTIAFVGPDIIKVNYGEGVHEMDTTNFPLVRHVIADVAPKMKCEEIEVMVLGEEFEELALDTTIRSIITKSIESEVYVVRRSQKVKKSIERGEIVLDENTLVLKGGTSKGLVEYLLARWHVEPDLKRVFFLMYPMMGLSSTEILEEFFSRFHEHSKHGESGSLKEEDLPEKPRRRVPEGFPEKVKAKLRNRIPQKRKILEVILFWFTHYQNDFFGTALSNAKNISEILEFLEQIKEIELQSIRTDIHRKLLFEMSVEMSASNMVLSSLNDVVGSAEEGMSEDLFMKYSPRQAAEQITFIDMHFIQAINQDEFVGCKWSKKKDLTHNINRMAARATHMVYWGEARFLKAKNLKERMKIAERLLNIADHLLELGNFAGLMNITALFGRKPVRRIPEFMKTLKRNRELYSRVEEFQNQASLLFKAGKWRTIFDGHPMPKLPFLGPIQTELTFLDTNPKYLEEEKKVINFSRVEKSARLIFELSDYKKPYPIEPIPELLKYFYYARGFDDHEKTAAQMVKSLVSKEGVPDEVVDSNAPVVELYDVSSTTTKLTEDTETILLNSRATLACLTFKERKKLWLEWGNRLDRSEGIQKCPLANIFIGATWKKINQIEKKEGVDFRELLLGSDAIDISFRSIFRLPLEPSDDSFRRVCEIFSTVTHSESLYDTMTVLGKVGTTIPPQQQEYILKIISMYKYLSLNDVLVSEQNIKSFLLEKDENQRKIQGGCLVESVKQFTLEMNAFHAWKSGGPIEAQLPLDVVGPAFEWLKTRKQLIMGAMHELDEIFGNGSEMVNEAEQFVEEMKKRMGASVLEQIQSEIDWLLLLQEKTNVALERLNTAKSTGQIPAPPLPPLPDPRRRQSIRLQKKEEGPKLPAHLSSISSHIEQFPHPRPLTAAFMSSAASGPDIFLEKHHLPLMKQCAVLLKRLKIISENMEVAYWQGVESVVNFHVTMIEQLRATMQSMETFREMGFAPPEQIAGLKATLQFCESRLDQLHLDVSQVVSKHSCDLLEKMQHARAILEDPIVRNYRTKEAE